MTTHGVKERHNRETLRSTDVPLMTDSLQINGSHSTAHNRPSNSGFRRWYWLTGAALLLSILAASIPVSRTYMLRSAGHLLVADQHSVNTADIIIVAIDADGEGTLEAADLMHRGISNRVAVFDDPPGKVDREFLHRGLPYEDRAAVSTRQLQSLGIRVVGYFEWR